MAEPIELPRAAHVLTLACHSGPDETLIVPMIPGDPHASLRAALLVGIDRVLDADRMLKRPPSLACVTVHAGTYATEAPRA